MENPDIQKLIAALQRSLKVADTGGEICIDLNVVSDTFSSPAVGQRVEVGMAFAAQADGTFKINVTA